MESGLERKRRDCHLGVALDLALSVTCTLPTTYLDDVRRQDLEEECRSAQPASIGRGSSPELFSIVGQGTVSKGAHEGHETLWEEFLA